MKQALAKIIERIADLIDTKTIVTIALTAGMLLLLSGKWTPSETIVAIYSTAYGSVTTYFFTKAKTA